MKNLFKLIFILVFTQVIWAQTPLPPLPDGINLDDIDTENLPDNVDIPTLDINDNLDTNGQTITVGEETIRFEYGETSFDPTTGTATSDDTKIFVNDAEGGGDVSISSDGTDTLFKIDQFLLSNENGTTTIEETYIQTNGDQTGLGVDGVDANYDTNALTTGEVNLEYNHEDGRMTGEAGELRFNNGDTDIGVGHGIVTESDGLIHTDISDVDTTINNNDMSADTLEIDIDTNTERMRAEGTMLELDDGNNNINVYHAVVNTDGEIIDGEATGIETSVAGGDVTLEHGTMKHDPNATTSVTGRNFRYTDGDTDVRIENFQLNNDGDLRIRGGSATTSGTSTPLTFGTTIDGIKSVTTNTTNENGVITGFANIETQNDGGISDVAVKLGDDISFNATDANGDARELRGEFFYDENEKRFFFKTTFVDGDDVQIKVMPFRFDSETVGDDAVIQLSAQLNDQNIEAYLQTVTGLLDFQEINNTLATGDGSLRVRVGGNSGMELMYANPKYSPPLPEATGPFNDQRELAFAAGFFNKGPESEWSTGVLVTGDSSFEYEIQHGTASFNGLELPDQAEIPLTIGAYHRWSDDDEAVFATVGVPLSEFEEGTVSAAVSYERKALDLGEHSASTRLGGAINTGGDVSLFAGMSIEFGANRINNSGRSFDSSDPAARASLMEFARRRQGITE